MESSIPTLTLTKGLVHQQHLMKEAVSFAIEGDMDMSVVAKHNVIFACHSSLLVLFSPLVARLLSEAPCCLSPTIFLPDFKKIHIIKLLHLLQSGQTLSGENVNADIEILTQIAQVLQISVTDINIGPYLDNPLGYPFQIKKGNNFNVKTEIKKEFEASNEKQETESFRDKQCEEMEECEYIEKEDAEQTIFDGTIKIEVANTVNFEISFGMETNNEEDMIEVLDKEGTSDGLENKDRRDQIEKDIGDVTVKIDMNEEQENKLTQNGLGFISSVTSLAQKSVSLHSRSGSFSPTQGPKLNNFRNSDDKEHFDLKNMQVKIRKSETLNRFNFEDDAHKEKDAYGREIDGKAGMISCNSDGLKNRVNIYTGEKRHLCSYCQKSFKTSSHLKVHTRIHTGENPFPCDLCPKQFKTTSKLKVHTRIHTGEKPFPCELCPKRFKTSSDLKVHMRIHTGEKPFQCEICPTGFKTSTQLKVHTRIHTGEIPFPCELCPKRFKTSSDLKVHTMIHTGEKPLS